MKLCLLSETQTVSVYHKGTLESFLSKNRGLPRTLCEALTLQMHSSCVVQKCAFARSIETRVVQKCAFAHGRVNDVTSLIPQPSTNPHRSDGVVLEVSCQGPT